MEDHKPPYPPQAMVVVGLVHLRHPVSEANGPVPETILSLSFILLTQTHHPVHWPNYSPVYVLASQA